MNPNSGRPYLVEHSRITPLAPIPIDHWRTAIENRGNITVMAVQKRILIVDDDQAQRALLCGILSGQTFKVEQAVDGVDALAKLDGFQPDAILTDLNMPRMDGFELMKSLQLSGSAIPVIALTGYGSVEKAVSVVHDMKAFWFLEKPVKVNVLLPLIERAISQSSLIRDAERLNRELSMQGLLGNLVGKSKVMQEVFSLIRQVAPSNATVLITGESGTGKEMVAREIHRMSRCAVGPFVAINCAALPESLIESELFGHEKGAFTGAAERRAGCFEQAVGGTLLLDEIGEMTMNTQTRLLRVLEDLKVRRLGGKNEVQVDSRLISATNRNPEIAIEKKELREDLFYRLNVFQIHLPPLRERKEDIAAIAEVMIHNLNRRHGTRITGISPEASERLQDHNWPGNVRELRNQVERAVVLAHEGFLRPEHFLQPKAQIVPKSAPVPDSEGALTLLPGLPLSDAEEAYILLTLKSTGNNRRQSAELLGISLRTLQTRLSDLKAKGKLVGSQDDLSAGAEVG